MDIIQLDQQVTLWINNLDTPCMYPVWMAFSDNKIWFLSYALVMGWIIWKLGWKKGLLISVSLILCVILTDQLSGVVKAHFTRLRPCYNTWMLDNGLILPYSQIGHLYGFFSSHAANVFGFAAASTFGVVWNGKPQSFKAYGWGVFIWATLVSISRIMLGAHFLGDILVGTLFGLAIGTAVAALTRLIIVKAKL
ncbi:MAG: phosphatase PAP2 family protein [Bacteroidales bacterium]|nr:phosphatase PAP2 family protein [Bacteroidales bacterium]